MRIHEWLKSVAAASVLGLASLNAAAVVGPTPPTFEEGLLPYGTTQDSTVVAGPFIQTWGFTLPTNGGFFAGVLNIPVTPLYGIAWTSLALVSNPDGLVGSPDDVTLGVPIVSGTNQLSLSSGALAAGKYYLAASGITNGTNGGIYSVSFTVSAPPVPEPEGYAMMLAGLGLVGAMVLRRRKP